MRIAFADCLFDSEARELTRAGRRLEVSPRAFDLLQLLLLARPRVLSKAELDDRLWPDTLVGRTSLARLVTELRKVTGDDAREPRLVRTVRGFGYAFIGEARAAPEAAAPSQSGCSLLWGQDAVALSEGENVIGRAAGCAVRIPAARVSRHHARIVVAGGLATLEDLGSTNGTYLHASRISERVSLADGDEITIGPAVLIFRCPDASGLSFRSTEEFRIPQEPRR